MSHGHTTTPCSRLRAEAGADAGAMLLRIDWPVYPRFGTAMRASMSATRLRSDLGRDPARRPRGRRNVPHGPPKGLGGAFCSLPNGGNRVFPPPTTVICSNAAWIDRPVDTQGCAPCFHAFLKRGMEAHHGRATVSETRKLAAILVADIVGYSRLAGADEDRILARLRTLRSDLIDPIPCRASRARRQAHRRRRNYRVPQRR